MTDHARLTDEELAAEVKRGPVFERYPALVDSAHALQVAWEKVQEWDYSADAHGWCHERPVWLTLIADLRAKQAEVERLRAAQHKDEQPPYDPTCDNCLAATAIGTNICLIHAPPPPVKKKLPMKNTEGK